MAKVFLDTNAFIDISEDRDSSLLTSLDGHSLFVSVISLGIWTYLYKICVPDKKFDELPNNFNIVAVDVSTAQKSFLGPTSDFEDNIQLHSAVESGCDVFITKDAGLLKMGYFGKVKIVSQV